MKTGQIRLHTMCHFNELNFKIMQSIKHFVIEKNMGFGPGQTWLCILVLPLADSAVMGRFKFLESQPSPVQWERSFLPGLWEDLINYGR